MHSAPKHAVPVFPLVGAVLFPGAVLRLRVFELRSRALIRDALAGERTIATALLKPGWERDDYLSRSCFPLGCLARFEEVEWLPDDGYLLTIHGVARVRFERVVREVPYRTARVRPLPQEPLAEDDPLVELERRALLDAYTRLSQLMAQEGRPMPDVGRAPGFEPLVNSICMALAAEATEKLQLLGLDSLIERSHRARGMLEAWLRRPLQGKEVGGEIN